MKESAPEDMSFHHTQIRQETLILWKGSGQDVEDRDTRFATTEVIMKPFESPDDALPAPLPEGGATEISGSCAPRDKPLEDLDAETKKIELHERLTELRDEQD